MTTATIIPSITTPAPTFDDVWKGLMKLEQIIERNTEEARLRFERNEEEAKKRSKEWDKRSKEMDKRIGALGNRLGDFVQEMVRPAAVRLFRERNLPVHYISPNVVAYDDNGQFVMEVDLMVINSETLIAVECKSNLSHDDVQEHLERLEMFKKYFSRYADYTVLGAVAGMVIPETVSRYAHKKGLYVLAQSGEAVEIRNPSGFEAREW